LYNLTSIFNKLLSFLDKNERNNALRLLLLILVMAAVDAIGVASIMPFMTLVTKPEVIFSNNFANFLYNFFDFKDENSFIWAAGVLVLFILCLTLLVKSYTNYKYEIGSRLFEKYLNQDYAWHLRHNSSDLVKNILSEVSGVIGGAMIPMMNLISHSAIASAIIIMLMYTETFISVYIGLGLMSAYVSVFYFLKSYLGKIGKERYSSNSDRFLVIKEAFGAIKPLKIESSEKQAVLKFRTPSYVFAQTQSTAQILSLLPRYLMEAVAFGGAIVITLALLESDVGVVSALPTISLFAFAGYKLMPSLQAIFNALTQLRFSNEAVEKLYFDYQSLKTDFLNTNEDVQFEKHIQLDNVSFSYEQKSLEVLKDVSIEVKKNSVVAIVGRTGCGKSTITDLILGLIRPTKGIIKIDAKELGDDNIGGWRRNIGYVPQEIFLRDASIIDNIVFGLPKDKINFDRIRQIMAMVCLDDLIAELPDGLQTQVGEDGIRLSGGQKQRIGIARALYRDAPLYIFDEATSAIDNSTESIILSNIISQADTTLIMVTHRLNTARRCSDIIFVNQQSQIYQGPFEELYKIEEFKDLVEIADR
jgi:ABC-type multidrug transport system fused ATPase/permease subunit